MNGQMNSFQGTIVRGVFLLAPIMVVGILLAKAIGFFRELAAPLVEGVGPLAGVPMPTLLSIVILLLVCYVAGLLANTRGAKGLTSWLESTLLTRIPAYAYMKGMGASMVGVSGGQQFEPVLARIEDAWQLGFIVETIEPGQYAVFVPGSPSPWSGSVYFMAEERIKRVPLKLAQVQDILKRQGIGSAALRGHL